MTALLVIRPTVRVNEFGVKAFPLDIGAEIVGRKVAVRDWYGENHLDIVGVAFGNSGFPCALEFSRPDGKVGRFSLFTTREIEVLP